MSRLLAAALVALLLAPPLSAQDRAEVQPGGVATVVTTVEAGPGDTLPFAAEMAPGVRLFGPRTGRVVADTAGVARAPFTVGVPTDAPAGPFRLGTVAFGADDNAPRRELRVRVAERWDVELVLGRDTMAVTPGAVAELEYTVHSRGNAADTFDVSITPPSGWIARAAPDRLRLAPGAIARGTIRLELGRAAVPGAEHRVRVRLEGRAVRQTEFLTAVVTSRGEWLGGLAQVPASVFVGSSSTEAAEPSVALRASGEVGTGTRMTLAVRHSPSLAHPAAFRSEMAGSRLRLDLEGERWRATAGDIFMTGDIFSGPLQQGRGGQVVLRSPSAEGSAMVATPWSYGPLARSGHLARIRGEIATPAGRIGAQVSSVDRRPELLSDFRSLGAGLTYGTAAGGHQLDAAAGWARVGTGQAARSGFAGSMLYRFEWEGGMVSSRLRTVPATTRLATSHDREAFVSALVDVLPAVTLTTWGFARSSPLVDDAPYPASRGFAGGFQVALPGRSRAELTTGIRETDEVGDTLAAARTRSARARFTAPVGTLRLEADLDVGTVSGPRPHDFRNVRLGVRWQSGRQWAWAGVTRYDNGLRTPETRLDVAGTVGIRSATLRGGLNVPVHPRPNRWVSLWSGLEMPLDQKYDLLAGVEHASGRAEPTRISVGVRRDIGLPIPTRRSPVLEGVVFIDANGNRALDAGESPVPDVELHLGALKATTGADGTFRFLDRGRGTLRVVPTSLPAAATVPADVYLPERGTVAIPVVPTASLQLQLFLDRDGDGVKDEVETAADGVTVSVDGPRGSTRFGSTDGTGRIRFTGMEVGEYTVRIERPGTAPHEIRVTLEPGDRTIRTVAVPARTRRIRLQPIEPRDSTTGRGADTSIHTPSSAPADPAPDATAPDPPARAVVLFEFESAELDSGAFAHLERAVAHLRARPDATVTVAGHTDALGAAAYNLELSEGRARAVAAYLRENGIDPDRIRTRGFGETAPVADNGTAEGRARNRRVEILLGSSGAHAARR